MSPEMRKSEGLVVQNFEKIKIPLSGYAILLIIFLMNGWGYWGMGISGDYALDMSDALRFFQGDVPYRDFLPTYGVLNMFLTAPWFALGKFFLSTIWIATAILIFIQFVLTSSLAATRLSKSWMYVLAILGISAMAFAPTSSKFILGYSPSGFIAVFLWTAILLLLWKANSIPRWFVAGIFLGFQCFTKIDMGITAVFMLLVFLVLTFKKNRFLGIAMAIGFFVSWVGILGFLIFKGASLNLFFGSLGECFGQATIFGDPLLKLRMMILFGAGMLLIIGLYLPWVRPVILQLKRKMAPWSIGMLIIALMLDILRGWDPESLKHMVVLNYLWTCVWISIVAHLGAAMLRRKTIWIFRFPRWPAWCLLLGIAGMGILRVSITGWYPLNYYQPAILLMGIFWFAAREVQTFVSFRNLKWSIMALALILNLFSAYKVSLWDPRPHFKMDIPFGSAWLKMDFVTLRDLKQSLFILQQAPEESFLFCTYEPSLQFLSGMRSSAFYTYFGRMGASGVYQAEREKEGLQLLKSRPPTFVVIEEERAFFARHFGTDFGREIKDWVLVHYEMIYESPKKSFTQRRIYQKREKGKTK